MFPNGIEGNDEGNSPRPESVVEWGLGRGEDIPLAVLVFKEDRENLIFARPTQGIKWQQNGRMYGYWEHDWDIKRLAFRWWWAQVMIDSLWARGLNYVFNKLRGWKRWTIL